MKRVLGFGAVGDDVAELQKWLNLLPSKLQKLKVDGAFGPKTMARVREFQSEHALFPDGIVGPLTWEALLNLLSGIGPAPPAPPPATDVVRQAVLSIARKYVGQVDIPPAGPPRGLELVTRFFQDAANVTLTDKNFKDPNGQWIAKPWIDNPNQRKSWCGIFCVYCCREAGLRNISWNIYTGKPSIQPAPWRQDYYQNIRPGDIGRRDTDNHHFLIESAEPKRLGSIRSIEGNCGNGHILGPESGEQCLAVGGPHLVGGDNFAYYSIV